MLGLVHLLILFHAIVPSNPLPPTINTTPLAACLILSHYYDRCCLSPAVK